MTVKPGIARRIEQAPGRRNGPPQQRDIVAERSAKAAGLEEIPLHIDDHEASLPGDQIEGIRFRIDNRHDFPSPIADG